MDKRPAESVFVRQSLLQERHGERVVCNVCARRCRLAPGAEGWCRTRANRDGQLVTLSFGAVSSLAANPIEKKPFYHFYPGSETFTVGSWSCNFGCPWCQNWSISRVPPSRASDYVPPERFVELTMATGCQGTSISFNEPTLSLEWSLEVFALARQQGLYNTFVTNGYMTPEALDLLIAAGLDAMNVDVKGDTEAVRRLCKGIQMEHVWQSARRAHQAGVHVEITTLVIPTVNDTDEVLRGIAERLAADLGPDVPWHVSGYYPAYRFSAPATPSAVLERAWHLGRAAGLRYVYVGNVPGHRYDNTHCPACNALLIRRRGFDVLLNAVAEGGCPHCGAAIAGVWGPPAAV